MTMQKMKVKVRMLAPGVLALPLVLASMARADDARMTMKLQAPIESWDEAVPLGNGLTGGLLWGKENTINLSLDRGDLWDERLPEIYHQDDWNYGTIRRLKAAGKQDEISRMFDAPYATAYPTKLPGGRLVLTLEPSQRAQQFTLNMRSATGSVDLSDGTLEVFYSAVTPVAMVRCTGSAPTYKFLRPAGLNKLGYQEAEFGQSAGMMWMCQEAALGLKYAVVVASRRRAEQTELAVAIVSNHQTDDPLAAGKESVRSALERGYNGMLEPHRKWWADFWATSSVAIPNADLQRHYNLVKYFYGAASHADAPPMPLQGVWTRDDGGLPPWKGDYHHDLNTQMTYLAYPPAGLYDCGMSFINYNWDLLPAYRKFAREFFQVQSGAAVPGVATLAGRPTGGWSQYALSPTSGLWIGHSFYLHWRYTMDGDFLANRAYPWLAEVATGVVNLLEEKEGKLRLPLSSSPEIHGNSLRAWLQPNSNYDLSLMRWTFAALVEMADALGKTEDAAKWRGLGGKLDDLAVDEQHVLRFDAREPFAASHRHHSHAMAIHPLGTLDIEGSDRDRQIIYATLDRMVEKGTQAWTGYSFSWFASMLARAGRAEQALQYLVDYERAFILRNGFHVNGDQIGAGLSHYHYRPFTLEGNFLAMQAVHEMLLQSWGGRVRIFPAVPKSWADVSFDALRAEGGFVVSAQRKKGATICVAIEATVDQQLRLRDPFGGADVKWNRTDVRRDRDAYLVQMAGGEKLEGRVGDPGH